MPCSAAIEPFMPLTRSCTMRLNADHWSRNASLAIASGCDRLKWMLPSPKCPKAQTRTPGIAGSQASVAASMNSATRDTGTATSCLIDPPSRR